jgi:hypothetical protein
MTLRLNGSTSGFTEIDAPAVAGSNTLVLPGGNGSANQFLKNGATAGALAFGTTTEDASGNLAFNSGYGSVATAYGCRAWVNFNGTGAVAIRASGNVSSITDNGTGDYTVNFTTAMVDANYSTVASAARNTSSYWDNLVSLYPIGQYSTAGVRIITSAMSVQQDRYYVTVAIFR